MEAAGYDVVLVETVGVGQSETVVADMTDTFLVLLLAGAGDELQGIKRGLLERAEILAINKADGDNQRPAEIAARRYQSAMHTLHPMDAPWTPPVLTCSGQTGDGVDALWETVERHQAEARAAGRFETRRREQALRWMWDLLDDRLREALRRHPQVAAQVGELERGVTNGTLPPTAAADQLLATFLERPSGASAQ
jgi:LAO/AO transport system kinase